MNKIKLQLSPVAKAVPLASSANYETTNSARIEVKYDPKDQHVAITIESYYFKADDLREVADLFTRMADQMDATQ